MSHFCRATANVEGRAGELFDAEGVETDAGSYNIHDGVNRADFMEMDFFERDVVDAGFGLAELGENCGGTIADLRRELGFQ